MIASLDLRPSSPAPASPGGAARDGDHRSLPARMLLGLIRLYQRTLSPALPVLTLGTCGCRFSPTCSHYAAEAIRTHGALAGTSLAVRRLLKCTPLHPGGHDPVPARVCSRVAA
jgi:putative membrane protein insertion efficiency factor